MTQILLHWDSIFWLDYIKLRRRLWFSFNDLLLLYDLLLNMYTVILKPRYIGLNYHDYIPFNVTLYSMDSISNYQSLNMMENHNLFVLLLYHSMVILVKASIFNVFDFIILIINSNRYLPDINYALVIENSWIKH